MATQNMFLFVAYVSFKHNLFRLIRVSIGFNELKWPVSFVSIYIMHWKSLMINRSIHTLLMNLHKLKSNEKSSGYLKWMHLSSWRPVVWHAVFNINIFFLIINSNYYACSFMNSYLETKWNICYVHFNIYKYIIKMKSCVC